MLTKASPIAIDMAAQIIKGGGLVAFPTETVYGIAADAFNAKAVQKLFKLKKRPLVDPLIVHVADFEQVEKVCKISKKAEKLMAKFWPGPLTLVLPKRRTVLDIVTAKNPKVAVRMPKNDIARNLIRAVGSPLVAPSANPFGYISPTNAQHVMDMFGNKLEMILDGGQCEYGLESTIIEFVDFKPVLLRAGAISVEEITEEIGRVIVPDKPPRKPKAPGQLPWHYAPKTKLKIMEPGVIKLEKNKRAGYMFFKMPKEFPYTEHVEVLSKLGILEEAATNLFSALHRLDAAPLDIIYAEAVPEEGLGRAIMDRLRKAQKNKNKVVKKRK